MKTLASNIKNQYKEDENYYDINSLLTMNKKIVTFIGETKSGTSFMINCIAQYLTSKGTDVAILDATMNRDAYYIYTENKENLRKIAYSSIEKLTKGIAEGILSKDNLTIYTGGAEAIEQLKNTEPILECLLKKHTVILIDCDFMTPIEYFNYATDIYLVQTMDTLTIQPFTEKLSKMKDKGVLNESKLRIIINKYANISGVTEKEIIGGLSYYNDPTMTYMKELFNRNMVPYIIVPFKKEIYEKYLRDVANCDINLKDYPYEFMKALEDISGEIYKIGNDNSKT